MKREPNPAKLTDEHLKKLSRITKRDIHPKKHFPFGHGANHPVIFTDESLGRIAASVKGVAERLGFKA